MSVVFLGIDLGTTTTLVASTREVEKGAVTVKALPIRQNDGRGGQLEITYLPSVAYFPPDSSPLVGKEAEIRGPEEDASRFVRAVKRQMGRRLVLPVVVKEPYEVSALYLAYALREGRRSLPMADDTVFTVTVPASFTTNQRADTLRALRLACDDVKIPYPVKDEGQLFISEPVAAALAFLHREFTVHESTRRLDLSRPNRMLVYDIGGGTLDLTLVFIEPQSERVVQSLADVRITVEAIGYYNPFGGEDFDLAVAQKLHQRLLERFPNLKGMALTSEQRLGVRLQLMNMAKRLKEELSEQMEQGPALSFLEPEAEEPSQYYQGEIRIQGTAYSLEGEMRASEYQAVVADLLRGSSRKSLQTPLKDLLEKSGFDSTELSGLLVVGGMARLPLVKETLREWWENDRVWVFVPPDHAVVTGAAIYSYLRRRNPGYILTEPAADAYYIRLKDRFDPILPAKEKEGEQKRYELANEADYLSLQIFAGEDSPPGRVANEVLPTLIHQGGTSIHFGKTYPKGTPVWVQMSYKGDLGDQDRSKVPWVSVWVENNSCPPLFRRRYSDLLEEKEESDGKGL